MSRLSAQKKVLAVALILFAIGIVWTGNSAAQEAAKLSDQPMIGEMAPSFSLMDLNDETISSDDLRGSYVVVHIAASW